MSVLSLAVLLQATTAATPLPALAVQAGGTVAPQVAGSADPQTGGGDAQQNQGQGDVVVTAAPS